MDMKVRTPGNPAITAEMATKVARSALLPKLLSPKPGLRVGIDARGRWGWYTCVKQGDHDPRAWKAVPGKGFALNTAEMKNLMPYLYHDYDGDDDKIFVDQTDWVMWYSGPTAGTLIGYPRPIEEGG